MINRYIGVIITLVFAITRSLALNESRDVWQTPFNTPFNTSPTQNDIDTVYIVFSCHLDIGFNAHGPLATDKAVIDLYFNTHFPNAIKTAQRLRDLGQGQSLSFLTHSYLISLYLDCPQYLDIDCPTRKDVLAFEQAIQRGDIIWHAFPFNGQAEAFYDPDFFSYAVQFTHQLDNYFNFTNKMTMSQRDVPGLTRSALPILASQGVKALSFGINAGSAPPDVPHNQLFRWRFNSNSNKSNNSHTEKKENMLVFIHPGGYSGAPVDSAEECIKVPALRIALCSSWKQDNEGPPDVDEVVKVYQKVSKTFPGAQKIVSSGFDDFTSQVVAALEDGSLDKDQLPLFEGEIGDSWIGGLASDPGKLAEYLQLLRLRKELLLNNDKKNDCTDNSINEFSRALLKIPEHTWGCDSGQAPGDYIHWSNTAFHSMLESKSSKFMDAVTTWWRQRSYNYWAASNLGGEEGKGGAGLQALQALWDGWKVPTPDKSNNDNSRSQQLVWSSNATSDNDGLVFQNDVWKIQLDPKTGAIIDLTYTDHTNDDDGQGKLSLESPADTKPPQSKWASYNGPLGEILYSTYAEEDYWINVWKYYQYHPWFSPDFSKPNSTYHGGAQRRDVTPHLDQVWGGELSSMMRMMLNNNNNSDRNKNKNKEEILITTRALFDEDLVSTAGAPRAIWTEIKSVGERLLFDVIWEDKTPTRLPEALWLRFRPPAQGPWALVGDDSWRIWKLGGVIDPGLEVVRNGSMSLHAVSAEGVSVDSKNIGSNGDVGGEVGGGVGGCQYTMQIQSLDAPLVSVGTPDLFFNVRESPAMEAGVAFNLVNNIWGTNYIMWFPYRDEDKTMRFRFELSVVKKTEGGGEERRGGSVGQSEVKGAQ